MIRLRYGASTTLRLEFPLDWDPTNLSALTLAVYDRAGNQLEAATAATIYTATSIDGAVEAGDTSIVLDSGAATLYPGDRVHLGSEEVEVLTYTAASYTIVTKRELLYDHADNAVVSAFWATYELDASDTAVFELGDQVILEWTPSWTAAPTGYGETVRERAEVVDYEFHIPGFEERFAAVFPREYDALIGPVNRMDTLLEEAVKQLQIELKLRGLFLDRVVDQDVLVPVVMQKIRWILLVNADSSYADERDICERELTRQFELLCNAPLWSDDDQDGDVDDDELINHEHWFARGF